VRAGCEGKLEARASPAPRLFSSRRANGGRERAGGKRRRASLAVAALLIALFTPPAGALDFPALSGRVVDEANVLDQATRAALDQKLAAFEARSTDQLVVVTLKSLQGTSIEDFGYQLGRRWQIGQKGKNNGVLLIVAPNERKVRIEVGYGLEGTLTDAVSRLIIENAIIPRFRANDVPGGITRGVDDVIQVLTGDAEEWKQRAAKRPDPAPGVSDFLITLLIIVVVIVVLRMMSNSVRRRGPGAVVWGPWGPAGSSGSGGGWSGGGGFSDGGGFSGGGGSFGGGGASGSW
jgi:uncharacterized protein